MSTTSDRAYSAGKAWRRARIKELTTSDQWALAAWQQRETAAARRLVQSLPTSEEGVLEHLFRAYRLRHVQEEQAASAVWAFEEIAAGRMEYNPGCPVRVTLPDYRCKDAATQIMSAIRALRSGKANTRQYIAQALNIVRDRRSSARDNGEVEVHLIAALSFWN
jgi:hypothetical protein